MSIWITKIEDSNLLEQSPTMINEVTKDGVVQGSMELKENPAKTYCPRY